MIIQCRQCRTKYSFDDAFMKGDGVWMRCSRCEHVFFHDNPLIVKKSTEPTVFPPDASATNANQDVYHEDTLASRKDDEVIRFLDNVMDEKEVLNWAINTDLKKPDIEDTGEKDIEAGKADKIEGKNGKSGQEKQVAKGFWQILKIAVWTIFVVLIVPAIIYFLIFPELGDRFIKIANKYISAPETELPEVVTRQVKLQDIRQRVLNNYILGQIHIVEGTAVNEAEYPISRIVIKGAIVDAYTVVLRERASFAGNILTDDELTTLSEEEILRKLAEPQGRNNSNDKILPKGQIPFMIVFTNEPPGMIKTTLTTIGAERLL